MALSKADVAHIARLARIHVDDAGQEKLVGELNHILGWVEQLSEVDTDDTAPMTSVVAMDTPMRDDVVNDGEMRDDVLANAPDAADGFFVVPKVVE